MRFLTPLGPGREFDVVRTLLERWGDRARGIGDDAAMLDVPSGERLVVSTDSSIEGEHFRREWLSAREIGYRATCAALSDLADHLRDQLRDSSRNRGRRGCRHRGHIAQDLPGRV